MYKTDQEKFWAGSFGTEYINRNDNSNLLASNKRLFAKILGSIGPVKSVFELGCNIGLNLQAIHELNQDINLSGYEINEEACKRASSRGIANIIRGSIVEPINLLNQFDLVFTKLVLMHINPNSLNDVYDNLYRSAKKYIVVCEYHNQIPIEVNYRGIGERLFKRDFAGEILLRYPVELVDYGFVYHKDPNYPDQDDFNWFILEKK